ncbi:DNA repair ATPase [soil metagenome]
MPDGPLTGGAYEVIRKRLDGHAADLRARIAALNAERQDVFGAIETKLVATERVTTEHSCTPRDMVSIGGGRFIFGYNVQLGLKTTTEPSDVFSVYQYERDTNTFIPADLDVDGRDRFLDDFEYLYKYYRETLFVKFMVIGPHLYIGFRAGKAVEDVKAYKFRMPGDGRLEYLGNRFDHEYLFPPQHEFDWQRAHRDMHRAGLHPHISIEDRVFVETVGGDLTVKVEDNTESGEGIYSEPVTDADQTLDDAETLYALVGSLIIIKIRPYQEERFRYLVFNEKTKTVTRVDTIADSCVLLPDEQGIVFSNGYLLQTGETKVFESGLTDMRFERRIAASNGEDTLYVFYNRASGTYLLMAYNVIAQSVGTPVVCHGYSLFPDGEMLYFRSEDQPQKHHAIQVWQTPFTAADAVGAQKTDNYLYKIGNAEIVRCMAECQEILNLLGKDDTFADLYGDLVKKTVDIVDSYFWVGQEATKDLKSPLMAIHGAAQSAIGEFDKVQRLRRTAAEEMGRVRQRARKMVSAADHQAHDDIFGYVHHLADLRSVRGEIVSLRDLRSSDPDIIESLESEVAAATEKTSQECVGFLLEPEALGPYRHRVSEQSALVPKLSKVTEAKAVEEALGAAGAELEMLIEIVGNLKIEDATEATKITEGISEIYAALNQVRAEVRQRKQSLGRVEAEGQFAAQMKLLGQAVVNTLDLCDTPERCDEQLTKLMVQLEELEGKFSEFDDYLAQLGEKREEIYGAFEGRKLQLLEARNKRAGTLLASAERILAGIGRRIAAFKEISEINGYFASDLMVDKVRDIIDQLAELGDTVKSGDVQTQLKTVREDAVRQLKDRHELFVDGKDVIRFGNHHFAVNTRELDLTVVPRDGQMFFHLAGTAFYERIADPDFLATRPAWDQEIVSEDAAVYRGEYLAYQMLKALGPSDAPPSTQDVQAFMGARYAEGYVKGVHDTDAKRLLDVIVPVHQAAGKLRYPMAERACALVFWEWFGGQAKASLATKLEALGGARAAFGHGGGEDYVAALAPPIARFAEETALFAAHLAPAAATYLVEERSSGTSATTSAEAAHALTTFHSELTAKRAKPAYEAALNALAADPAGRFQVIRTWLAGCLPGTDPDVLLEAAAHELRGGFQQRDVVELATRREISGLLGDHPTIAGGTYPFDYNALMAKMARFEAEVVPRFLAYHELRARLVEAKRTSMRLGEFKPEVMSAFVRNRLLDKVYLPLIGDNLAKQLGTAGDNTRTDRMGMLLLVSPPGYGKTTLMEYVANRLGITFVKINGPALGHHVTSLDPADAPNASAREEVNKLNFSLEMGDNVMIYLDDIQHCNPEFLQKFISLCDAQRKIEGVWNGQARTYDLRGKKVAVVMAGNPYTESGGKFQIPDMLANRADTYNLGDIIGESAGDFEASYIENALTSNSTMSKLASRSQKDVYAVMRIAESGSQEGADFEGNYSPEEIDELVSVTKKLMRVRDTILRVNLEYIRSAAMEDAYRTEPAFRLQGSYRNMNRIAEKVLAIMTADEVESLVMDHYENESQTLTTGAEANLLKFKDLEGILTDPEAARWAEIKKTFTKNKLLGGAGEHDPVARVVAQLSAFNDGLEGIGATLATAAARQGTGATLADATLAKLEHLIAGLRAVPVEVEIKVVPVQAESTDKPRKRRPAKVTKAKGAEDLPVDIEGEVSQGDPPPSSA